jgi:DNA-directed RNA polymerase specialized sigma54-like protein
MNSQQDFGRQKDIDAFIRKIKEQNEDTKKFENILKKMDSVGDRAEDFLKGQIMVMHDYQKDPELINTLQEIINTPGYDPKTVEEAQRQMLRIRQGLPRFPTA